MGIINEETCWIFLLPCASEPDLRHIYDIAYGVYALEQSGILSSQIKLFIDGTDREHINGIIRNASDERYEIETVSYLIDFLEQIQCKNIVLFVSGHGGISGLNVNAKLSPYNLINLFKNIKDLETVIMYLGQCYAGVFNFMPVSGKTCMTTGNTIEPEIIIIGATNLFMSISTTMTAQFKHEVKSWCANIFLFFLFQWIMEPIDVDGDEKFTVIDSFKYAGATTNNYLIECKKSAYINPLISITKIKSLDQDIEKAIASGESSSKEKLIIEKEALKKEYEQQLSIQFNHQEPWILNAIPAQKIEF